MAHPDIFGLYVANHDEIPNARRHHTKIAPLWRE